MSNLTGVEKVKLEKLFGMGSGYVLDFTNRTFQEFILEHSGLDIFTAKYEYGSGSKANRLRTFWQKESNYLIGKILVGMLDYWKENKKLLMIEIDPADQALYDECRKIADRLRYDTLVEDIDAIQPNTKDRDFAVLAKSLRESIAKNEPEVALDRLHTFVVKYVRQLCDKHGISYDKSKALHSLFGEYIKCLKKSNLIESEMTERILKSSISILEAFNSVRNEQSFAHDNPVLNYRESILIFNNVSSAIKFIEAIEEDKSTPEKQETEWSDFPF